MLVLSVKSRIVRKAALLVDFGRIGAQPQLPLRRDQPFGNNVFLGAYFQMLHKQIVHMTLGNIQMVAQCFNTERRGQIVIDIFDRFLDQRIHGIHAALFVVIGEDAEIVKDLFCQMQQNVFQIFSFEMTAVKIHFLEQIAYQPVALAVHDFNLRWDFQVHCSRQLLFVEENVITFIFFPAAVGYHMIDKGSGKYQTVFLQRIDTPLVGIAGVPL